MMPGSGVPPWRTKSAAASARLAVRMSPATRMMRFFGKRAAVMTDLHIRIQSDGLSQHLGNAEFVADALARGVGEHPPGAGMGDEAREFFGKGMGVACGNEDAAFAIADEVQNAAHAARH